MMTCFNLNKVRTELYEQQEMVDKILTRNKLAETEKVICTDMVGSLLKAKSDLDTLNQELRDIGNLQEQNFNVDMSRTIKDIKNKIEEKHILIESLEERYNIYCKSSEFSSEQMKTFKKSLVALRVLKKMLIQKNTEIVDLRNELEQYKAQYTLLSADDKRTAYNELWTEYGRLNIQYHEKLKELTQITQQLAQITKNRDLVADQFSELKRTSLEDSEKCKMTIGLHLVHIEAYKKLLENYTAQTHEKDMQHAKKLELAKEDLAKIEKRLEIATGAYERSHAELQTTRKDLETTRENLETTQGDLQKTRGDLEETRENLETTRENLETTQGDLQKTQGELQETQGELQETRENAQRELVILKKLYEASRKTVEDLELQLQNSIDENKGLNAQIRELLDQIELAKLNDNAFYKKAHDEFSKYEGEIPEFKSHDSVFDKIKEVLGNNRKLVLETAQKLKISKEKIKELEEDLKYITRSFGILNKVFKDHLSRSGQKTQNMQKLAKKILHKIKIY